ncbi:MAG: hypothetical protein IKP29_10035 [Pseudobutyrivibrio sp.]|nr:hypothetical protein [Butyrivibrio sp. XBB1001]MBR4708383.1 hypothetical protein [Pseudobutyrivibrio sp.]
MKTMTVLYIIAGVIILNLLLSVVFFILEGKIAKQEGRKRDPKITTWLCASLVFFMIAVGLVVLLYLLVAAFMASM